MFTMFRISRLCTTIHFISIKSIFLDKNSIEVVIQIVVHTLFGTLFGGSIRVLGSHSPGGKTVT
jgi:hypothetical protein